MFVFLRVIANRFLAMWQSVNSFAPAPFYRLWFKKGVSLRRLQIATSFLLAMTAPRRSSSQ
jgi:hypothetical protein